MSFNKTDKNFMGLIIQIYFEVILLRRDFKPNILFPFQTEGWCPVWFNFNKTINANNNTILSVSINFNNHHYSTYFMKVSKGSSKQLFMCLQNQTWNLKNWIMECVYILAATPSKHEPLRPKQVKVDVKFLVPFLTMSL